MHFKFIIIASACFATSLSFSQKVKENTIDISCFAFPTSEHYINNQQYSYSITGLDDGNKYGTFENGMLSTSFNSIVSNLPRLNASFEPFNKKGRQDYHVSISYTDVEIKKRDIAKVNVSGPNPGDLSQPSNAYDVVLNYNVSITLVKGNDSLLISFKSSDETVRFPDFVPELNTPAKVFPYEKDVENYWLTHRDAFVKKARMRLLQNYLQKFEANISKAFTVSNRLFDASMFYIKERKKQNPAFDSLFTAVELAKDSIELHFKKKNYKHWNTPYVQEKIQQAYAINKRLMNFYSNESATAELDKEVKEEIQLGLRINAIKLLIMQNRTSEAKKEMDLLRETNTTQKVWNKQRITDNCNMLEPEIKRYNPANIKRFHW